MARTKGTLALSANFEVKMAEPLDARSRVATKAELILAATWTSTDSNVYTYVGMPVSVYADSTAANNGIYRLKAADYKVAANWEKMASSDDLAGKANYSGAPTLDSTGTPATADVHFALESQDSLTALKDGDGNIINQYYQPTTGKTGQDLLNLIYAGL